MQRARAGKIGVRAKEGLHITSPEFMLRELQASAEST